MFSKFKFKFQTKGLQEDIAKIGNFPADLWIKTFLLNYTMFIKLK